MDMEKVNDQELEAFWSLETSIDSIAVSFIVKQFILDTNKFVIIKVSEFDCVPTICGKLKRLRGKEALKKRGFLLGVCQSRLNSVG